MTENQKSLLLKVSEANIYCRRQLFSFSIIFTFIYYFYIKYQHITDHIFKILINIYHTFILGTWSFATKSTVPACFSLI